MTAHIPAGIPRSWDTVLDPSIYNTRKWSNKLQCCNCPRYLFMLLSLPELRSKCFTVYMEKENKYLTPVGFILHPTELIFSTRWEKQQECSALHILVSTGIQRYVVKYNIEVWQWRKEQPILKESSGEKPNNYTYLKPELLFKFPTTCKFLTIKWTTYLHKLVRKSIRTVDCPLYCCNMPQKWMCPPNMHTFWALDSKTL